jgi:hypothetical protein
MRLDHQKAIAKKNQSFADAFDEVVVVTFAPLVASHTFAYVVVVASVVPMSPDMVEAADVLRVAFVGVIVVMAVVVVVAAVDN